jgi:hypothetical protein
MGVHAPPPRPSFGAALLVAGTLSVPFVVIAILELLF